MGSQLDQDFDDIEGNSEFRDATAINDDSGIDKLEEEGFEDNLIYLD